VVRNTVKTRLPFDKSQSFSEQGNFQERTLLEYIEFELHFCSWRRLFVIDLQLCIFASPGISSFR